MKTTLVILTFATILTASAQAQTTPQPQIYVPWTVDQETANKLLSAFGEIPAKFSLPLIQFLQEREQMSVTEKNKAELEAKEHEKMSNPDKLPKNK